MQTAVEFPSAERLNIESVAQDLRSPVAVYEAGAAILVVGSARQLARLRRGLALFEGVGAQYEAHAAELAAIDAGTVGAAMKYQKFIGRKRRG